VSVDSLLVISDFDGTLAPISLDPAADAGAGARIDPLARRTLRRLAGLAGARPGRLFLAVLSGRPVADVAARVRVGGIDYFGNHGLEGGHLARGTRAEGLSATPVVGFAHHEPAALALGRAVAENLGRPSWLYVEKKGPSVAFHWRGAPDERSAGRAVERAMSAVIEAGLAAGFERLEGRKMAEFRPADAGAKGAAVARLLGRLRPRAALILGDDRSDADAFGVIVRARTEGTLRDALAVAVHGAHETPAEVVAAADIVLASPREAARLLAAVARALETPGVRATGALNPGRPEADAPVDSTSSQVG
jgi:trehalose 6-phosphate phosphatase